MGAIVAIMGEAGDPQLPERLERMLARSHYRGTPECHFEGGLAIAVQTRGWDASLATAGNWTVAIHGVIGNWSELAPAHGWEFPENASSATKLAIAYEHLGDDLFGKLRGEFSILIYDRREDHIVAVRDLWGRRPLFFERKGPTTFIASEIRQIRSGSETPNEIDGDVLIQAILWKPTYPTRTHVRGIGRVQAGQINVFRRDQSGDPEPGKNTWEPTEGSSGRYNFEAMTEELRVLIDQAVDRWLIGIPFAVSLSGGVDSSTVWCSIANKEQAGDPHAALARLFSCRNPRPSLDESAQVKRILAATATQKCKFVDPSNGDGTVDLIRNAERMDSPYYGAISTYRSISRADGFEDIDLVLGGFGGDLVLGGSRSYLADLARDLRLVQLVCDLWTLEPPLAQRRLSFIASKTAAPVWRRLKSATRAQKRQPIPDWIHPSRQYVFENQPPRPVRYDDRHLQYSHQCQIIETIEMQQGLAAQEGAEQLRASEGLALGSPLIDIDILDFAFRLPPRAFTNGKRYKELLRSVSYNDLGQTVASWKNPSSDFSLARDESKSLERLLPPRSWTLVREKIVDLRGMETRFAASGSDPSSSALVGDLTVVEAVVRALA